MINRVNLFGKWEVDNILRGISYGGLYLVIDM
jgi:hypothetical protein